MFLNEPAIDERVTATAVYECIGVNEDRAIHVGDADLYLQLSSMFQGDLSFCLFVLWGGFWSNNG